MSESIEFKTRGIGSCGEILLGSNEVRFVIQSLITGFEDELNKNGERIAELEKENLRLKKFSSFQGEVVANSEIEIAKLKKELDQKSLYFVGYTNGNQIAYAKEDEGSFYVNTDNDCYIPVYMLAVHLHRLGGTASEEWMTVLQTKQLGEGVQS
jgi:uncharacterized metal-binding protein